jgi:hypothetical protein
MKQVLNLLKALQINFFTVDEAKIESSETPKRIPVLTSFLRVQSPIKCGR